jgi:hypothetical protein
MTQDRNKRPINRLQSMHPLRALVDQTYLSSLEAQAQGKPVMWSMLDDGYGVPFFNAMEVESVYPVGALQKAEVFESAMNYYRKIRKENGLEW